MLTALAASGSSYFKWGVVGRQLKGIASMGTSFLDWAPSNLQARLRLYR